MFGGNKNTFLVAFVPEISWVPMAIPCHPPFFQAYLERQKRGPDLARLRCGAAADDLVKEMLAYEEPSRCDMVRPMTETGINRWEPIPKNDSVVDAG